MRAAKSRKNPFKTEEFDEMIMHFITLVVKVLNNSLPALLEKLYKEQHGFFN